MFAHSAEATQRPVSSRGGPSCRCYCFAACQNDQARLFVKVSPLLQLQRFSGDLARGML